MECSEALKIKNMVNSGANTSSVSAFKKAMAMSKARECGVNSSGAVAENTKNKAVAPNKGWYNYRAREGEQGKWTGKNSIFKNGNTLPVKSCATTTLNNHGRKICANNTTAKNYNYVE
jgi:hypothetical protein